MVDINHFCSPAAHPYRRLSGEIIICLQHFFIQSSAILIFSWLQLDQETSHFIKHALLILRTATWADLWSNGKCIGSTETVLREAEGNLPQNGNFTNKQERTLTEL